MVIILGLILLGYNFRIDMIVSMGLLSPYHAVFDCYAKTVTLSVPDIPPVLWHGAYCYTPNGDHLFYVG